MKDYQFRKLAEDIGAMMPSGVVDAESVRGLKYILLYNVHNIGPGRKEVYHWYSAERKMVDHRTRPLWRK